MSEATPIMFVRLIHPRKGHRTECFEWTGKCPLCGKTHIHGAGVLAAGVERYLGARCGHCVPMRGDYVLVRDPDDPAMRGGC